MSSSQKDRDLNQYRVVRYANRRIEFKRDMIDKYDKDRSGTVTQLELDANESLADRESKKRFIMKHDINKDGILTLDEIWKMYKKERDLDFTKDEEAMIILISDRFFEVEKFFRLADTDNSGYLTMGECWESIPYKDGDDSDSLDNLLNIFRRVDKDEDRKIKLDELWKYFIVVDFPDIPGEMDMRRSFRKFDKNKDGKLSDDEITEALKNAKYNSPCDVQVLYRTCDLDGDGKISLEDFIKTWKLMLRDKSFPLKASSDRKPSIHYRVLRYSDRRIDFRLDFIDPFDKDGSGTVTYKELNAYSDTLEDDALHRFQEKKYWIMDHDTNKDGDLNLDEIWRLYKKREKKEFTKEEEEMIIAISDRYFEVEKFFKKADTDKSGHLTMKECYESAPYREDCSDDSLTNLVNIFRRIDKDEDYKVTMKELWRYFEKVDFPDIAGEITMRESFRKFDKNGDGKLCDKEITEALEGTDYRSPIELHVLYETCDHDGDGKISMEEFIKTWKFMLRNQKYPEINHNKRRKTQHQSRY